MSFNLLAYLYRQNDFQIDTYGPHLDHEGIIDHIEEELQEIAADPHDLEEWIDVIILAAGGAMKSGHTPQQVIDMLEAKMRKNELRDWPDWRTAEPGKKINHIREGEKV